MREKIKTLVLHSNGPPKMPVVFCNTLIRGVLNVPETFALPAFLSRGKYLGKLGRAFTEHYARQGYLNDWREELKKSQLLDVVECDISNLIDYHNKRPVIEDVGFIIILHSATGDDMSLLLKTCHWFHKRKCKMAVFLGNEYDLMWEKTTFLYESGAEFACSQLPVDTAEWLYADVPGVKVLPLPHALNPAVYFPGQQQRRTMDIGFRGARYLLWIGDTKRNDFLDHMIQHGSRYQLSCDIRYGTIARGEWAGFLRTCHGTIGGEAGSCYLDKRGELIETAKRYLKNQPHASLKDLTETIGSRDEVEFISGKAISSRHFEPIGTKTCQLLLEGRYNDLLEPGVHYLSVKPDLSNLPEVIIEFKDEGRRKQIAEQAHEHVMSHHTYRHRVRSLIKAIFEINVSVN